MAVVALALVGLSSCSPAAEEPQAAPTNPESTSVPPLPATPSAPPRMDTSGVGTSGLNIRYLGKDGKVRTLEVKDFDR